MADVKLTTLIAGMVLVGLILGVFGIFMGELSLEYNVTENGSDLSKYNRLDDLEAVAEDVRDDENRTGVDSNPLDLLGDFFKSGYTALKTTDDSINLFLDIADEGTNDMNLGASKDLFRSAFITIIIIFVVVGVFIAAIVKRDL